MWEQTPVEVVQVSEVQTLLSLQSLSWVQPPHEALLVQVSLQAEEVLTVEAQFWPEQALWVPEAALVQKAEGVPAFWQVSVVQVLLSLHWALEVQVTQVPDPLQTPPLQGVSLALSVSAEQVPEAAWQEPATLHSLEGVQVTVGDPPWVQEPFWHE